MSRSDNSKKYDLDDVLSVLGFLFEMLKMVVKELRARNGSIEHLRELLREDEKALALRRAVFDLIVPTPLPLPYNVILGTCIMVDYGKVVNRASLAQDFPSDDGERMIASILYEGAALWQRHPSRLCLPTMFGKRATGVCVVEVLQDTNLDWLAELLRRDHYFLAVREEMVGFCQAQLSSTAPPCENWILMAGEMVYPRGESPRGVLFNVSRREFASKSLNANTTIVSPVIIPKSTLLLVTQDL
ncbi:hypothetical protein KBA73_03830 [Patescibacteria group bacterium]|nr:hypothetical protein [Patescibacteria group bacterium]